MSMQQKRKASKTLIQLTSIHANDRKTY